MRAKFFKRSLSFLIDANLVFGLIYLTFILFGRTLVQSSVPNYVEHERLYIIELEKSNELIKENLSIIWFHANCAAETKQ